MTFGDVWEFLSEHREHKVLRSSITLGDILNDMLKCHQEVVDAKLTIAALNARAEQAEKAFLDLTEKIAFGQGGTTIERRGQPQDGEWTK